MDRERLRQEFAPINLPIIATALAAASSCVAYMLAITPFEEPEEPAIRTIFLVGAAAMTGLTIVAWFQWLMTRRWINEGRYDHIPEGLSNEC